MLPPHESKIALYLLMQSPMLGIVKAGGIFRLFCFDDLLIDPSSLDIHSDHWGLTFEEFSEYAKIFDHNAHPEILEFYPESQNQMILEMAWKSGQILTGLNLADLVKLFRPVQYGRITKT